MLLLTVPSFNAYNFINKIIELVIEIVLEGYMEKIGVMFSGGVAKGAYQIGFCKALLDFMPVKEINVISACSIGTTTGFALISNKIDIAEELWMNCEITEKRGFINKIKTPFLADNLDILLSCFNPIKGDFYVNCCEIPLITLKYFNLKDAKVTQVKKILQACISIPAIAKLVEIDGKKYVDAAILDNMPISPLINKNLDCILVVHFDPTSTIDYSGINKRCNIIEFNYSMGKTFCNESFNFTQVNIKNMIEIGYDYAYHIMELCFRSGIHDHSYIENVLKNTDQGKSKIRNIDFMTNKVNILTRKLARKTNNL